MASLETEIEMKDAQIANEEETSGELLKELEFKKHTIAELERELQKMKEKNSSLKEHIKKYNQSISPDRHTPGSNKGSSNETSEDDKKSCSSLQSSQKVARKYEVITTK
ncbi:hypothetical protein RFI_14771 [Reticulomyxa filosa]|uniref:Uncharacterized protein n=1 Tax=Reticulomyxa filosa TaxID=46433 RepID=X6N963_RETFI|nr:hypothetical protein RFI_14771 [Reticulomyxa filosa]|eukprot:ETO22428.1 hypothetical protein RFI_14771 [Reticulomyxa filosa]